jgi:hypothetical protein
MRISPAQPMPAKVDRRKFLTLSGVERLTIKRSRKFLSDASDELFESRLPSVLTENSEMTVCQLRTPLTLAFLISRSTLRVAFSLSSRVFARASIYLSWS